MNRIVAVFFWVMLVFSTSPGAVGQSYDDQSLFSQSTSDLMVRHAVEIFQEDAMDPAHIERAMVFLHAAQSLDEQSKWVPEQVLRIGAGNCYSSADYSEEINWAIVRYLKDRPDLEIAGRAVGCMLEQLNSRPEREVMLERLYQQYASQHPVFASDIITQLGLLKIEKADIPTAASHFLQAYALNPYNQLASQKMLVLTETDDSFAATSSMLMDARMRLDVDPYNLETAEYFASLLHQLRLYDLAEQAYSYVSKLGEEQFPDRSLSDSIVYNWLSCCYLGQRMETKCLEIAERYRSDGHFDLRLEAYSGRSMIKLGQAEQGRKRLEAAGQKAETLLSVETMGKPVTEEDLAWFYSFVLVQQDKALAWSNIAVEKAPERKSAMALFAYVLAESDQVDLAKQYIASAADDDPVTRLTKAVIALKTEDKPDAIKQLRSLVNDAVDPFIAEHANELLITQGSDTIPEIETDAIRTELKNQYPGRIVPDFVPMSEWLTAKLLFNGSEFLYDTEFQPRLVIGNSGKGPLVIDEGAFFSGRIHVNAVTEGDLSVELPDLVSMRFRPARPLAAGEQLSIPLDLKTGKLRTLLLSYPQAEIHVHFTVYLDPVVTKEGIVKNRITEVAPVTASVRRKKTVMSRDFLMQRLETLSQGRQGQKLQAASLFTGLLAEQQAMVASQAVYKHIRVEPRLVTDAVRKSLVDPDWKVRSKTLSSLIEISTSLEGTILNEIAQNLNHEKWPVRLLAMYLVAKTQPETFQKVLDWTAENDANPINRRMALALRSQGESDSAVQNQSQSTQ